MTNIDQKVKETPEGHREKIIGVIKQLFVTLIVSIEIYFFSIYVGILLYKYIDNSPLFKDVLGGVTAIALNGNCFLWHVCGVFLLAIITLKMNYLNCIL